MVYNESQFLVKRKGNYMLELKNITKNYPAGGENVLALKGISLKFRNSEFVSILGPSGCGKTTMLNIIGGLDKYSDGDLLINERSTKEYKDRDWDSYRNHSIGFVFQSYNLIPHQTVLQNVELALTLSGVSKTERRQRAITALEQVGLGNQLKKRPSEMSGGQMQRVAIARAIVNNPDIILADEPTGALDTETSVQVMDILKEIAKDRLVIMVTHNPELADKYSTRIVRMLDGNIISDSMPLTEEEEKSEKTIAAEKNTNSKKKKPSMSLWTSFGLSLKNLFTKKGRTILTSFAGSIGIIGIALIYAVSHGMTAYINTVQEDTLTSYPLVIEETHLDMSTLLQTFMGKAESVEKHEKDAIYQKAMVYTMLNSLNSMEEKKNDLKSFKEFIEKEKKDKDSKLSSALSGVQYTYNSDFLIYTKDADGNIIFSDTEKLMSDIMMEYSGVDFNAMSSMGNSSIMSSNLMQTPSLWREILPGENGKIVNPAIEKQYQLVYGHWPTAYNEVVLFVDENNELNDLTLYALGLTSKTEVMNIVKAAYEKKIIEYKNHRFTYEEICNKTYRTVINAECFRYDSTTDTYTDLRESQTGLNYIYDKGIDLKVTGIVRPDKSALSTSSDSGGIGYTYMLTEYLIEHSKDSDISKAQLERPNIDIFTGLPFKSNADTLDDNTKMTEFKDYADKLDDNNKLLLYTKIKTLPDEATLAEAVAQILATKTVDDMKADLSQAMAAQTGMSEETIASYINSMGDENLKMAYSQICAEQYKMQYAANVMQELASIPREDLLKAFANDMNSYTTEQFAWLYDNVLEFSSSTYKDNLSKMGYVDLDTPATISLYASTFANKDIIEDEIARYNKGKDDLSKISYTDYVGLMMSSITTIINAITYVLISFVAVSLIVSSIMIGVITLISVQERTKEIGILRAIGASKKNVSSMFNAETVIIGFTSGALGVIITYLLCIPINMVMHKLTNINNLNAILPIPTALILILISMLLTLISGIIPSRSAAKKDPVVALRTE